MPRSLYRIHNSYDSRIVIMIKDKAVYIILMHVMNMHYSKYYSTSCIYTCTCIPVF